MKKTIHHFRDVFIKVSNILMIPALIIVLFTVITQLVAFFLLVSQNDVADGWKVVLIISSIFSSITAIATFLLAFLMIFYIFSILWPISSTLLFLSLFFIVVAIILGVFLIFSINYTSDIDAGYVFLQTNYKQWWFILVFFFCVFLQLAIVIFLGRRLAILYNLMPEKKKHK